jgi:hypothetical protein
MVGGCRLFRVGKIIKAPLPVGEGDELRSSASVSLWYYFAFLSSVEEGYNRQSSAVNFIWD